MIKTKSTKAAGKRASSLSNQKRAIIILLAVCLVLAVALAVVNFVTALRRFEVPGDSNVYYIVRQKDDEGKTVYVLADKDRNPLSQTSDGRFITLSGAIVEINQETGLGSLYARPVTDGNEQVGRNDRIVIFPVTDRSQTQSIKVYNEHGEFAFYRRRVFVDTDMTVYTCMLVDGDYYLLAAKDPTDPESEFIDYKRDDDGYFTLRSGNRISVNRRTGVIRSVTYKDYDGKVYSVVKDGDGYALYNANGEKMLVGLTKTGELTTSEGEVYTDTLYSYIVTDYGTLLTFDRASGIVGSWGVKEYDAAKKKYSVYHFITRDGKYILTDVNGALITETSLDDKDYYCTANNAYIAFNEQNGSYKVRVQKNYYLVANNDGLYTLYNKDKPVATDASGYCPLNNGTSYLYFDAYSGSFTLLTHDGEKYVEGASKYLNATDESDTDGSFVIEGYEDTDYDDSYLSSLITNGGYTVTPQGGKLTNPSRLSDGSIDYSVYGLVECDRVDAAGQTYHHVPAYYVFTDLEGNVHKITFGDKVISGSGYYVRYEGINVSDTDALDRGQGSDEYNMKHEAVYILLDNYSTGFTDTYETYYYYAITDTFLSPIENLITPKVLPSVSLTTYFDVKDFVISTLNYDKLHDSILKPEDYKDSAYRDVWINFSYQDIEERRNSAYSSQPYVMGACELFGYTINDANVDICLKAMMDMKCIGVRKLGASYSDFIKYGLDEPEYVIRYTLSSIGETPTLLVSKLTPNSTYYVYTEMYDMIVEVDRAALAFLNWTNEEWVTDEVYRTSVGFCDKIKLESGDWWATFDLDMSQLLETKLNSGTPSTFYQKVFCSDDRKSHYVLLNTTINGNTSTPIGSVDIIQVDFDTLLNYRKYVMNGNKSEGLTLDEEKRLAAFIETISDTEYSPTSGTLSSAHNLTLTDGTGRTHIVTVLFDYSNDDVKAYVRVNNEDSTLVFSMDAYEAYEKIMFSEETTSIEKKLAYDFYAALGVSPSVKYSFNKITAENSDGTTSIFAPGSITKTDKDGNVSVDYCIGSDYRLFFNVDGNDIIGVSGSWVRYYDMDDTETTQSGLYTPINKLPHTFKANQVRFTYVGGEGTQNVEGGTLGNGNFTVTILEDRVTVTDENGNVTTYLRYAGTSVFSNFYATILSTSYEGTCDLTKDEMEALKKDDTASNFTLTIDTKLGRDKDGKCTQLVFKTYRYSERRSYITVNGNGEFFVLKPVIDKIVNSSKQIFDNVLIDTGNRYE